MFVTRINESKLSKEEKDKQKKIDYLTQIYVRSNDRSKLNRKLYGPDWKQPQAINVELCYNEEFDVSQKRYGLKTFEKFGDIIVKNKFQEHLE